MLLPPDTEDQWHQLADDWYHRWNFPHVIEAIDGKHIACKTPANNGSDYFNYKGFCFILLAVVSSDYRFLWIDVSGMSSSSDAHIYNETEFKEGLQNNDIVGFPKPDPLPGDTQDVPYFLVGDDVFGPRTYMMKPYANRDMTREQRISYYRLSRNRRVVENTFGILASRFEVLTTMMHEANTVRLLVKARVLLHNLMRTRYPVMQNRLVDWERQDGALVLGVKAGALRTRGLIEYLHPPKMSD
jgi:hypothetical protein